MLVLRRFVQKFTSSIKASDKPDPDLILLVENMGRVNYERPPNTLNDQTKGFAGTVTIASSMSYLKLNEWKAYRLEFKVCILYPYAKR